AEVRRIFCAPHPSPTFSRIPANDFPHRRSSAALSARACPLQTFFRQAASAAIHKCKLKETHMVALNDLQDLLVDQLRDLYDAEHQLTKALPKMAKAATRPELRQAFEKHLDQTEEHVSRLEQVFEILGQRAKAKTCKAMKGLIEEGSEVIKENASDS